MKTITSPEFRKTYQRLTEKVVVTVHGHPIGVWEPFYALDKSIKVEWGNSDPDNKEKKE